MSTDDRSGYLPPHELRALFAQVVDRGEAGGVPPTPGPSVALSTPGLAGAALAPPAPAPAFAADDPNTVGIMLSRMANELGFASVVPQPTPESLTTGAGMSAPASPGAVPSMMANAPGAPSVATDAITPQLVAMTEATNPTNPPPGVAGGPSGSASESNASHAGPGGTAAGWGTPSEMRAPDFGALLGASADPWGPFGSASGSALGMAPSSTAPSASQSSMAPSSQTAPSSSRSTASSTSPSTSGLPETGNRQQATGNRQHGLSSAETGDRRQATGDRQFQQQGSSAGTSSPTVAGSPMGDISPTAPGPMEGTPTNTDSSPMGGWDGALGSVPTSSMQSGAPGRPGFGMPASNVASPGGMPGAPASVMPSAPTIPFGSNAEHAGNAALGRFGAVPPVGGAAIASPGTLPTATLPSTHELEGFAGESSRSMPDAPSTMTRSSAGSREVAAPPRDGSRGSQAQPANRSPFEPTSLDGWTSYGSAPHGSVGRLPLFGDGDLAVEPMSTPEFQLPLIDGLAIDAAPGYSPKGSDLQRSPVANGAGAGAPRTEITGGETLADSSRAIRQTGVAFDPYAIRKDFPILEERVHGGKRLVWLDNAATTQKPRAVIDRLTHFYEHENSNVHRAAHTLAARATDAFESARETTRKFLNAPSASEIVFVRGATEGINLIAKTWGRKHIAAGDEIVLTHLEHHANIVPWQMLCAETGAKLRIAPVDDRGSVILERYERLINPRTKLVAFTQVSNALGTITPAREMIEIAHRHGATVLLDGAQAVSHMAVDVQELGCDFYVFSGHKVFAPTGIGAVFGKTAILEDMPPWQGGGNMIADVTFEKTVYQQPPWRFEAGTGNIADAAGLGAALDYVMRIGMNVIDRYEHDLLVYATDKLVRIPGLTMIGTSPAKAGVLSFVLDGQRTEDVGAALDKEGIAVRSGHHCAQPILRRFGLEASVRASLAFYNVCEDIDALVEAVTRLQARRRSVSVIG